jgi:ribonucleoside-triphosphate reductase
MGIIKNTKIGYFSFTKILTACNSCYHVEQGMNEKCFNCGSSKVDYISRVTGYLSNVGSWNASKKQEFLDRKKYTLSR